ncbi:hypothetical protein AB1N83_012221, partial [Pleurotus pulmonarius]
IGIAVGFESIHSYRAATWPSSR